MPLIDITGQTFGRLTVIEPANDGRRLFRWRCSCSCGGTISVRRVYLLNGRTRSCGCLRREMRIANNTTHGQSPRGKLTPEYRTWLHISNRCYNPKDISWKYYGGRGITMCERWRGNFAAFLADVGPKPSAAHSIDRIDNDLGYSPENCRWATKTEQSMNRRPRSRPTPAAPHS